MKQLSLLRKVDQQLPLLCHKLAVPENWATDAEFTTSVNWIYIFVGKGKEQILLTFNAKGEFCRAEQKLSDWSSIILLEQP